MSSFRYKAFISYSHQDEAWASGLHKALESYTVPRRLVGGQGAHGVIPKKLSPVFRDRDDLSSAADLSEKVQDALQDSESLIVVCSPASANSRWVNEEIRLFRSLGRGDRIFCIIVDGDPKAVNPDEACFPPALLEPDSGVRHEPLAADARKWEDGKSLAKLKLVSAILGIRLDKLRQREQQKKRRLRGLAVLSSIAIVALVLTTLVSRMAENTRREHAEALVSQLVEVSAGLDEVVDLETLRSIGERLAAYLDTLDEKDLNNESRLQIGLVLRRLGEVSRSQGRPTEAMDAFDRSRNVLMELAGDAPGDLNALFELGQAEFWVGYIHLDRGEWDKATIAVNKYLDVSRQLFEAEPENAEWAMEMAYAASSLGTIESRRVPTDQAKLLEYMQSAMNYNQKAVTLAPGEEYYQVELASSHANLADAWLEICNLGGALNERMSNVEFAAGFFNQEPNNKRLKSRYAFSLAGLARVQQFVGLERQALKSLGQSVALLDELTRQDPSNLTYRWQLHHKSGAGDSTGVFA